MNRAQALHDVDRRIGAVLLARADPPLTGVPIPSPQVPPEAVPPGETGTRVCRGMSLVFPPGVDVFALFAGDWERAGFRPRSWSAPEGPVLVAWDPEGFILLLRHHAGRIELYVISPLLASGATPLFYGGLGVGALVGFLGPCLSTVLVASVLGSARAPAAFVPLVPCVLAVGGGLLIAPGTRQFGLGLLLGSAITGIVTAGVCASALS